MRKGKLILVILIVISIFTINVSGVLAMSDNDCAPYAHVLYGDCTGVVTGSYLYGHFYDEEYCEGASVWKMADGICIYDIDGCSYWESGWSNHECYILHYDCPGGNESTCNY